MLLNIDILHYTRIAAWTVFGILIFAILYRLLLKKLQQGRIEKELYFILYPIEQTPVTGEAQIFIEMYTPIEVEVSVLSSEGEEVLFLEKRQGKKGGNIISFDTTKLENGSYFYQAKSENQKTKKKIEIKN